MLFFLIGLVCFLGAMGGWHLFGWGNQNSLCGNLYSPFYLRSTFQLPITFIIVISLQVVVSHEL